MYRRSSNSKFGYKYNNREEVQKNEPQKEKTWRDSPIANWEWISGEWTPEQAQKAWELAKSWNVLNSAETGTFIVSNLPLAKSGYTGALAQVVLVEMYQEMGLQITPNWVRGKGDGGIDFYLPGGSVDVKASHHDPYSIEPKMFSWLNDKHNADFYFNVFLWEGNWYFTAGEYAEKFIHENHLTKMTSRKYPDMDGKPCYSKLVKWCNIKPVEALHAPFTYKTEAKLKEEAEIRLKKQKELQIQK